MEVLVTFKSIQEFWLNNRFGVDLILMLAINFNKKINKVFLNTSLEEKFGFTYYLPTVLHQGLMPLISTDLLVWWLSWLQILMCTPCPHVSLKQSLCLKSWGPVAP